MNARIVKTERLKNLSGRYVLHFEDDTKLTVSEALVARFSLFAGRELEAQELKKLKSEIKKQGARAKAAAMVGARPLSEKELKRKLVEKGNSAEDAEDASSWLREMGAVNDAEYASTLVSHYTARGYGKAKIKDEFFKRGIPRDIWEEALSGYTAHEESISRFIESRLRKGADRKELKRVSDALYRRGFSWEEIQNALAKYTTDFPEE